MITLLSKLIIENKNLSESKKRSLYGTLCGFVGIFLNFCLFAFKYFAGTVSGSIAITADAFNNLSDAGSSFITLAGFVYAEKKPDEDHPFGHGRFEYISGFIVSVIILIMGVELAKTSVEKVLHPTDVTSDVLTMVILVCSITVKLYMCFYNRRVGKKIDSAAMKATALDSLSDVVATSVVLLSMIVIKFFGVNLDGFGGIAVSLFILYTGYNAAKDSMKPLLGTQPDLETVEKIEEIVLSHDVILGMHDLIVHDYGPERLIISLHAEVSGNENIFKIHSAIDHIEEELSHRLGCEAVIHMDPIESDNEVINKAKEAVTNEIANKISDKISIHDFRMVVSGEHTNVIFDASVPFEIKQSDKEIKSEIVRCVRDVNSSYRAIVKIDRAYTISRV